METTDVLVIGSGFGGATVAARLVEAGARVTLLERGPWRRTVHNADLPDDATAPLPRGARLLTHGLYGVNVARAGARLRCNRRGYLELFDGGDVTAMCTSNVGGGSHVYTAITVSLAGTGYWDGVADGVCDATLAPHYDWILARLGSHRPGSPEAMVAQLAEVLAPCPLLRPAAATAQPALGLRPGDTGADWSGCGVTGSPGGGKRTLDEALLRPAMMQGLRVESETECLAIAPAQAGAARWRVEAFDHRLGATRGFAADRVVVAAGTLNTLRLLLAARAAGSLRGLPMLGERFSGNGDVVGIWRLGHTARDLARATPCLGRVEMTDEGEGTYVVLCPLNGIGVPGLLPARLRAGVRGAVLVVGMGPDSSDGTVTLAGRALAIRFDGRQAIFRRLRAMQERIAMASGRGFLPGPARPSTAHPMGGACVADGEQRGVIDGHGQVFGHPGLFVADMAALPRATGVPPAITTAAWAGHVAAGIAAAG